MLHRKRATPTHARLGSPRHERTDGPASHCVRAKQQRHPFCRLALALALGCLPVTACATTPATSAVADEATLVCEGVDTPLEILGYRDLAAAYPCFLNQGDKVAVIAPSALPDKSKVEATIAGLKTWGFEPVEGKYVSVDERTLDDCLEDVTWALGDPEIKAIFCVRGGYGSSEVLDILPLSAISEANKPIIGYSDISAYHSAWSVLGLSSFHTPTWNAFLGNDLSEGSREAMRGLLKGQVPVYECQGSEYDIEGTATGVLVGGNLSTLITVSEAEYDCLNMDEPYILFLEDVSEDLEHVHRDLTELMHRGVLDKAQGIVFGEWVDYPASNECYTGNSRGGEFKSMREMISRQFLEGRDIPVAFGFPAGHGSVNYPLLLGARVRLDVRDGHFTLEWTGEPRSV